MSSSSPTSGTASSPSRKFFEGNTKIAEVTERAGVQAPPAIEFLEPIAAAGTL
ncbi:hypothetical protein [Rhodococcus oxybenzonivorans]|uniref:hypothetical protein n=1 Tax=Rhodococcus oxybenzonivorans TaxID=1990687 RepID=UPI0013A57B4C|nr:hypothetical protein [Rhodococcus oxybenzonivorans]